MIADWHTLGEPTNDSSTKMETWRKHLEIVRDEVIPHLREHDPLNTGLPVRELAKTFGIPGPYFSEIVNSFPRYLERLGRKSKVATTSPPLVRIHPHIA